MSLEKLPDVIIDHIIWHLGVSHKFAFTCKKVYKVAKKSKFIILKLFDEAFDKMNPFDTFPNCQVVSIVSDNFDFTKLPYTIKWVKVTSFKFTFNSYFREYFSNSNSNVKKLTILCDELEINVMDKTITYPMLENVCVKTNDMCYRNLRFHDNDTKLKITTLQFLFTHAKILVTNQGLEIFNRNKPLVRPQRSVITIDQVLAD